ncbi:MAG: response regulator [Brachymonas sp.]|nr:response regulator [Brachymonas sp.]
MKLKDLIDALAGEIEAICPQLAINLDELHKLNLDDAGFLDALDQYSSQVQRMGEAMELAGFPGLQAVCAHVLENTLLLLSQESAEREPSIAFLRGWPALVVHYLQHLDDAAAAESLVEHLRAAPHPLDEDGAARIVQQLGAMPAQVNLGEDEPKRPLVAELEDVALEVPEDADQRLMEGFFQEAPGQAATLVELVGKVGAGEASADDITSAKRVAHTLKGSGAIIGLRGLASLGHHFEDVLEYLEKQEGRVAQPVAAVLMDGAYCLEQMVAYVVGTDEYPRQAQAVLQNVLDLANRIDRGEALEQGAHVAELADSSFAVAGQQAEDACLADDQALVADRPEASLAAATDVPAAAAETAQTAASVTVQPPQPVPARRAAPAAAALRVSMSRIEELFRVSAEVSVHTAAMEARLKQLNERARDLLEQNLRLQKRLFELETVVDVRALSMMRAQGGRDSDAPFDPLEMDQYNELHSTAHALAEEASDARAISQQIEEAIAQLAGMQTRQQQLSRDLQYLVIGTRMTEVGVLESRLQRNVRTTCQATGKMAVLTLKGASTLIDSDVLNKLAEPLLHMLRNAVDHGLEAPHARRKAGKSEVGSIVLDFSRQGQQVVLRCQDDGAGLDLQAIQRRALEHGLIRAGQPMSEEEIVQLITLPGFSTRDAVSEVSGRGVGMDVVRAWVERMNGVIRISSQLGKGTTVELRFAATLSTLQSLVVEASEQRFALPSLQVEQAVPKGSGSFVLVGNKLQYRYNNRILRALHLAEITGLPIDPDKPLGEYDAVVVRVQDKLFALAVDRLIDSRDLLVKNPGRFVRHIRGVAGLSVLSDGGIAVHLDLMQLLLSWKGSSHVASGAVLPPGRKIVSKPALPGVLVVDDALTVRNTLQQLVEDAGFAVETARDGLDALDKMRTFMPQVVLTDLEMPNMNGVELTQSLRSREDTRDLPIIMITSRSQDKHRELAQHAGVNAYITKPYNEGELLRLIRQSVAA